MEWQLGRSEPETYGAATLDLILAGFAAYPVGPAIDHGRFVMASGSLIAGLFLLGWSQAVSLMPFYLCVAGIGIVQAATLYEPAFAVVARRSGSGGARAGITTLTLWGGFASTVLIPIVQHLLDTVGCREPLNLGDASSASRSIRHDDQVDPDPADNG